MIILQTTGNHRSSPLRTGEGQAGVLVGCLRGGMREENVKEVGSEPSHLPTWCLGLLFRLVSATASSSAWPEEQRTLFA